MRVLVTRPQPGADKTAARLAAMGHETVKLPLFESRLSASVDVLPDAAQIDGFVATSVRAFWMFGAAGVPPAYHSLPVFAVGPATADAAREAGFRTIHEAAGSARDLAATILGDGRETSPGIEAPTRLIYLAGRPRKPLIETTLAEAGWPCTVVECYQMSEISYATDYLEARVLTLPVDAVLLYSANAADRFSRLMSTQTLREAAESAHFGCLSAEVAAALPAAWRARAVVPVHPDEASLLASLCQLG